MDVDEKWAAIATERRALAELLAGLDDDGWDRPSLCTQWRVRDVAAHVALTPHAPGVGAILLRGLRARGDFDAVNRDLAREHADRPHADLVTELRADAGNRAKPAITTLDNLLFDVLVHVQDIAIPLGRAHAMPVGAAREGAERVWRMGWPFRARRTLSGLRLEATDVDWTVGDGEPVRGPVAALLLLMTGRTTAAVPRLHGPGTARLATPPAASSR